MKYIGTAFAIFASIMFLLMTEGECIGITMKKSNIFVKLNSSYSFRLDITQDKSQVNPIEIEISH